MHLEAAAEQADADQMFRLKQLTGTYLHIQIGLSE